jgi:hypothetical protein
LPPGFPLDFDGEEGVLRGIVLKYSTNGLFFFCRSSPMLISFSEQMTGKEYRLSHACSTCVS